MCYVVPRFSSILSFIAGVARLRTCTFVAVTLLVYCYYVYLVDVATLPAATGVCPFYVCVCVLLTLAFVQQRLRLRAYYVSGLPAHVLPFPVTTIPLLPGSSPTWLLILTVYAIITRLTLPRLDPAIQFHRLPSFHYHHITFLLLPIPVPLCGLRCALRFVPLPSLPRSLPLHGLYRCRLYGLPRLVVHIPAFCCLDTFRAVLRCVCRFAVCYAVLRTVVAAIPPTNL